MIQNNLANITGLKSKIKKYEDGRYLPVVEEFYSLQGEGFHMGKPAYFLRIGGCDVGCSWCDTKISWNPDIHPKVDIETIIDHVVACPAKAVVITGGEPLMFNLDYFCDRVRAFGIETLVETSGAHEFSGIWDWICLSPKVQSPPADIYFEKANELKIIVSDKKDLHWAIRNAKKVNPACELYLQPEWSVYRQIIPVIVDFILKNPEWKISIQAHKFMKIP